MGDSDSDKAEGSGILELESTKLPPIETSVPFTSHMSPHN